MQGIYPTTLLSKEGQYQLWDTSKQWDRRELNSRREALQASALPTELQSHINSLELMEGIEPPVEIYHMICSHCPSPLGPTSAWSPQKDSNFYDRYGHWNLNPARLPLRHEGIVEPAGLEPTTSRLKILCATNCTTAQYKYNSFRVYHQLDSIYA